MDTQTTRTTLRSFDRAEYLVSSTLTQLSVVSPLLTEALGVLPPGSDEGAAPVDWSAVQQIHAAALETSTAAAEAAAHDHRVARVRVRDARRERSALADVLRGRHRNLRKTVEGTYGAAALPLVGLEAPPANAYLAVREQCRDVVKRMRNGGLKARLGEPLADAEPLDLERLAAGMESDLAAFEAALAALTEALKQRDEAAVAKKAARRQLNRVIANVGRVQEGYYRLAGLDELADRIRLTLRSPRPRTPEPGGSTDDVPAADAP